MIRDLWETTATASHWRSSEDTEATAAVLSGGPTGIEVFREGPFSNRAFEDLQLYLGPSDCVGPAACVIRHAARVSDSIVYEKIREVRHCENLRRRTHAPKGASTSFASVVWSITSTQLQNRM